MQNKIRTILLGALFGSVALFALGAFIFWTVIPYAQMTRYISLTSAEVPSQAIITDARPFSPDSSAEGVIRSQLLDTVYALVKDGTLPVTSPLVGFAIEKMQEQIARHPGHYLDLLALGKMFVLQSSLQNDPSLAKKAEDTYTAALAIIPERQDVVYEYAVALMSEGRIPEAVALIERANKLVPDVPSTHYILAVALTYEGENAYVDALANFELAFKRDVDPTPALTKVIYQKFFVYFYQKHDLEHLYAAVTRLIGIDPAQKDMYEKIQAYMDAQKAIPVINIAS